MLKAVDRSFGWGACKTSNPACFRGDIRCEEFPVGFYRMCGNSSTLSLSCKQSLNTRSFGLEFLNLWFSISDALVH